MGVGKMMKMDPFSTPANTAPKMAGVAQGKEMMMRM
jgi:hypothetical protein